ncbi:penicillin-binding protein 2 [Candidatus Saccharibacteria bacterium]|nr:penicillin-binding protein 2 [Candidatus Saccharibacteria bacterium]
MAKVSSRITILKGITFVALAIITVRLFAIQIIEHDEWVAKANEQHTLLETITARRGEIYMMDGEEPVPVVLNQTAYQIVIDPAITDKESLKNTLETYAKDYISADLDKIYSIEGLRYYVVARNVPYRSAKQIAEKVENGELSSVWLKSSNQRVYPEGELGSTLLGFVNADGIGQYGVEGSLNKVLSGKDGMLKTISDVNNVALSIGSDNVKIPAEDGKNIVLSVDRGLERVVEDALAHHIDNTAATNAAALVMNPNTGEILAMTSLPGYDPADYGRVESAATYINQVTEVPYEPASICKNFAFSAAINEGKMTAETTYFNQGYEIVDGWKIMNAEQRESIYGAITMKTALYWSLNTGSIHALKLLGDSDSEITRVGRERLYDYYHNKFRLGQATGIELIEAEGYIEDPNEGWGRNSTYANMTFGQNLGITMLQTATAFSAVVNGGYWRTPTIVKGVLEKDGSINANWRRVARRPEGEESATGPAAYSEDIVEDHILSEETSATMRDMLVNNRNYKVRGGIDRPGYSIGGKSGTAQVIVNGAYDNTMSNLVGSYIGFISSGNELPEVVIMVKMWGEGAALSGGEAGDLFDTLSNDVIDYLKIKPVL